jgi:hypothetical protein
MHVLWYTILGAALILPQAEAGLPATVEAGGRVQSFTKFVEDYERCKARQEFTPERGEYETKAEYRQRIERLRQGCDSYRQYEDATVSVPIRLSYDVDGARFELQLPVLREFHLDYGAIVWDDFPAELSELPRDEWHVDEPTPRASVYKACPLRTVTPNTAFFDRVEAYRPGSWRGCTTYYDRDDEVGWRRVEDVFSANDVTFYAYVPVARARSIRDMEENLAYVVRGSLSIPDREFKVSEVELRNLASGDLLLRLEP